MRMSDLSSDVCSSDLVVNERDMLGSDLVPDYLTDVDEGDFFGWPWYYWGGFIDPRVAPEAEDRRQYVKRPAYGLGAHVAPLGLTFTQRSEGRRVGKECVSKCRSRGSQYH